MRVVVIGGKLQGLETLYLARKAGFVTILIDKRAETVALNFCNVFLQHEFGSDVPGPKLPGPLPDCIIPALEDHKALAAAQEWAASLDVPFAFDLEAFTCSSSKLVSNELFHKLGLPIPGTWPTCSFPVIAKPDSASGSRGVRIFQQDDEHLLHELANQKNLVIQQYITGPSYSIEIIGQPGMYHALQVTDLGMDEDYDCCQVTAPSALPPEKVDKLGAMAVQVATELTLKGIMDLEVILHDDKLYILEIDARIPSQTPMAVYWSTGINMIAMLVALFCGEKDRSKHHLEPRHVLLEHIKVSSDGIQVLGEHIMTEHGPLELKKGFHGADEAILSKTNGQEWVATLICTAGSASQVAKKRTACHDQIIHHYCSTNRVQ